MAKNIIIKHNDGTTFAIEKRSECTFVASCTQSVEALNEDCVDLVVKSAVPVDFRIGDKTIIFGRPYWLNQAAKAIKTGEAKFEYALHMEGVQYQLARAAYNVNIDTTGSDLKSESLTADLTRFVEVLAANINRVVPGLFVIGSVPDKTETKTLTFGDTDNCLSVLQRLCQEYKTDFVLSPITPDQFKINIGVKGRTFPFTFRFGNGRGIYMLTREKTSDENIVNRLMVYGSSRNITSKYRSTRLLLPGKLKKDSFVEDAASIDKFGVWENAKTFEDIYPHRTGYVRKVESGSVVEFYDTTMDFDLNEMEADGKTTKWLIKDTPAKVHFNTGNLAGMEFDVASYDHKTRKIKIKAFKDENDFTFPSEKSPAFQFNVNDEYVFLDINLPDQYISNAETKLLEEGTKFIKEHSTPKVKYSLNVSRMFIDKIMTENIESDIFWPGDMIQIQDKEIDVDRAIRVTAFKRDVMNPCDYQLTIADGEYQRTIVDNVINDIIDHDRIIEINGLKDPARARRNWRDAQEVLNLVFDPEGDYYSEKIKPESIETVMLSVGAKSMQFGIEGCVFEPNYGGAYNKINISDGSLVHYTIDAAAARRWNLVGMKNAILTGSAPGKNTDETAFYIYAKCQVSGQNGQIVLSTEPKAFNNDPLFYHFWIGVLNSVDPGMKARSLSLTYGFTTINGRFIKTGVIMSADGETYFDLDNSEIGGRIVFTHNGQKKTLDELGKESSESKDYINNTLPGILDEIYAQLDGQIEQFFYEEDPTLTNAPAKNWNTSALKENHLGDLYYNTVSGKVWRWVKDSKGVYSWSQLSDSEVANALALANDALKLAKEKRRIFTSTPYTPYEVGDLWVQGSKGDIYKCKTERLTGSYSSSDWEKASKYTNDDALINFINGAYSDKMTQLTDQIDGKVESWFQTTDPAAKWSSRDVRKKHVGDTWYSSTANALKFYVNDKCKLFTDEITNGRVFYYKTQEPTNTNYPANNWMTEDDKKAHVGDLYFDERSNRLYRYDGSINIQTMKALFYWSEITTENLMAVLHAVLDQGLIGDEATLFTQQPSSYFAYDVYFHGDYISRASRTNSHFDPHDWMTDPNDFFFWQRSYDQNALDAYNKASNAQDTADGKRRVFVKTPYTPYDVGDLWVDGKDLRRCQTAKAATEKYNPNDWVVAVNYDNTKTVIDGGVVTSGTIQLAGSGGSILAGITGEGTSTSSIRIWAGASFENRSTAPFRVTQGGKVVMENAVVKGEAYINKGSITNAKLKDVEISGSFRNAFHDGLYVLNNDDSGIIVSTPGIQNNNNVVIPGYGGSWGQEIIVPFSKQYNGFRAIVMNDKFNGQSPTGNFEMNAPAGKWFYDNGKQTQQLLVLPYEGIEMIGYGDDNDFRGWIVLRHIYTAPDNMRGFPFCVSYFGMVRQDGTLVKVKRYDNATIRSRKLRGGRYRIDINPGFSSSSNYYVMLTCDGSDSGHGRYACVTNKQPGFFEIYTGDDASENDSAFIFAIINTTDF